MIKHLFIFCILTFTVWTKSAGTDAISDESAYYAAYLKMLEKQTFYCLSAEEENSADFFSLAFLYEKNNQWEKAEHFYHLALTQNHNLEIKYNILHMLVSVHYIFTFRENPNTFLEYLYSLHISRADIFNGLGFCRWQQKDPEKAFEYYTEARKIYSFYEYPRGLAEIANHLSDLYEFAVKHGENR